MRSFANRQIGYAVNIFTPEIASSDWYVLGIYIALIIELSAVTIAIVIGLVRWIASMFSKQSISTHDSWSRGSFEDDTFLSAVVAVVIFVLCAVAWPLTLLGIVIFIAWIFFRLRPRSKA